MSEEKKDFEVKDRRIFADEDKDAEANEQKEQTHPAPEEQAQSGPDTEESPEPEAPETSETDAAEEQPEFPEINSPTFVVSLNASALLHLGAIEDPTTGEKTKNLSMAKQTIDILSMLEEKTAGNLNNEEENLLKNILYDLRLMYVKEMG